MKKVALVTLFSLINWQTVLALDMRYFSCKDEHIPERSHLSCEPKQRVTIAGRVYSFGWIDIFYSPTEKANHVVVKFFTVVNRGGEHTIAIDENTEGVVGDYWNKHYDWYDCNGVYRGNDVTKYRKFIENREKTVAKNCLFLLN